MRPAAFKALVATALIGATAAASSDRMTLVTSQDGSNGYTTPQQFARDRAQFQETETVKTGLGPLFNADSCVACHQNPIVGGSSVVSELRAGHFDGTRFVPNSIPGLPFTNAISLVHANAIHPDIQPHVLPGNDLQGLRMANPLMGLGYVEAIDNNDIAAVAQSQPGAMRGVLINVRLLESTERRTGRFGWKNQHASLLSFAADAYVNEMGITSPLAPFENNSNGLSVAAFDVKRDPEDEGGKDIKAFTRFMRSLKVPNRNLEIANTVSALRGEAVFNGIGCAVCHHPAFKTASAGTVINGGTFTVPPVLGDKLIFPFSDFLLHDVGTGDGIVMDDAPQATAAMFRTAPLWGLRHKTRMGHDGRWKTVEAAIIGHGGQALPVVDLFLAAGPEDRIALLIFLISL